MAIRRNMRLLTSVFASICFGLAVGFLLGINSLRGYFGGREDMKSDFKREVSMESANIKTFAELVTRINPPVEIRKALVRVFNWEKENEQIKSFADQAKCTSLKVSTTVTSPICVYDQKSDQYVSGSILRTGQWEGDHMAMVQRVFSANQHMELFDIGCNIGVYTVLVAKLGYRVVAVDPMKKNLMLLSRSLRTGGLTENTTLLWNAVGDKVENITLHEYVGNIGGTYVKPDDGKGNVDEMHRALAVTLDHLISFFSEKPIFIKLDIETYEWNALKSGEEFFTKRDVRYVLMEWVAHRKNVESANNIISFMNRHSMLPHSTDNPDSRLQYTNNASWPGDVVWIKKT